jgi:hypothetical protein
MHEKVQYKLGGSAKKIDNPTHALDQERSEEKALLSFKIANLRVRKLKYKVCRHYRRCQHWVAPVRPCMSAFP